MSAKIYVACLAAYNNGKLHGRWIEANQDLSEIQSEVAEMLKASPERFAEEWAVHDFEGLGEINLSEWPDLARVSKLGQLIAKHGDTFSLWYSNNDGQNVDIDDLEERFNEAYRGAYETKEEFSSQLLEDTGALLGVPDWLRGYIDFRAYTRDLECSGDYSFVRHEGEFHVFTSY